MSKRSLFLAASPLYLFFYMGDAFLSSYYSLYFISRNIPEDQSAILLALIPFSLFLGCLVLSALAKTRKRALWLFRLCALIETGLVIGYAFCDSFIALLPMTILLGFFNGAPFALIEGYLVPAVKAKGGNYATIRMFGSLGYIVSLAMGYFLLSAFPIQNCFLLSGGLFLTALGLSFLLREKEEDLPQNDEQETPETSRKFITLPLVLFWLCMFFLYGSYNASSYLLPVRLKELGFLDQDYSLARSIAVMVELGMLLLMPFLTKRMKQKKIALYVSFGFIVIATSCLTFVTEPWSLAYLNLVLGHIGKAFLFAYEALWLTEVVGKEKLGKALTVNTGGINLATALLNLSSASLHQTWGFQGYFGLLTGLEILGFVLLIPSNPKPVATE